MKQNPTWVLWVLLGLLVTPMSAEISSVEPALQYTLEGEDLPRYTLFTHFLNLVESVCSGDQETCDWILQDLGVAANPAAEALLMRAVRSARDLQGPMNVTVTTHGNRVDRVMTRPEYAGDIGIDRRENPAEFWERTHALALEKAREYGRIHRRLETGLLAEGVSMDGIDRFIRAHLIPGIVVVSDKPFEGDEVDEYRVFDDEIQREH